MSDYLSSHTAAEGLPETEVQHVRSEYLAEKEPFREYADRESLPTGASASSMSTGTIGSTRYFEKDLDAMGSYEAASNIAASIAIDHLPGDQPETVYDPDSGSLLMEEAGGRAVPHYRWVEGFAENITAAIRGLPKADEDAFYDAIATHVSLHNDDISGNILIDKEDDAPQTIHPIDYDFAGRLEYSPEALDRYEETARSKAEAFEIAFDPETFHDRLRTFADQADTAAMEEQFHEIEDQIDDPYIRDRTEEYLDNITGALDTLNDQTADSV